MVIQLEIWPPHVKKWSDFPFIAIAFKWDMVMLPVDVVKDVQHSHKALRLNGKEMFPGIKVIIRQVKVKMLVSTAKNF